MFCCVFGGVLALFPQCVFVNAIEFRVTVAPAVVLFCFVFLLFFSFALFCFIVFLVTESTLLLLLGVSVVCIVCH